MPATIETLRFPGSTGAMLAARLDRPASEPVALAILSHCFTCSKDLRAIRGLASALADRGFAVLRFDFTGLGESEGDFSDTGFSSMVEDLLAAAAFLRGRGEAPRLLIGHSLGGTAVLAAARGIPECRTLATIASPAGPSHMGAAIERQAPDLMTKGEAEVWFSGRKFRVRREFLLDMQNRDVLSEVADLRRALLVLHSPVDEQVSIHEARRIFEAARHPKSFIALDGADHLLTRSSDIEYAASLVDVWARPYL